jgi:hypothetical protein
MNSEMQPIRDEEIRGQEQEAREQRARERRAQISELIVAYFIRGIRSLDEGRRGPALAARRAWTPTALPNSNRRSHPWESG